MGCGDTCTPAKNTADDKIAAYQLCVAKTKGTQEDPVFDACMCSSSEETSKAIADALAACPDESIINKTEKEDAKVWKLAADATALASCKKKMMSFLELAKKGQGLHMAV